MSGYRFAASVGLTVLVGLFFPSLSEAGVCWKISVSGKATAESDETAKIKITYKNDPIEITVNIANGAVPSTAALNIRTEISKKIIERRKTNPDWKDVCTGTLGVDVISVSGDAPADIVVLKQRTGLQINAVDPDPNTCSCMVPEAPTLSSWGLTVMGLAILIVALRFRSSQL